MFGRQKKKTADESSAVPVDATLEGDIARVEQSVQEYLAQPSDDGRRSLLESLEALDARAAQSDAYRSSVIGSGALGYASKGEVIGETSLDPVVDQISGAELAAQLTLVKAAKDEVRGPTAETLATLRRASADLATTRGPGPSEH
jgi:hypothetical protein